MATFVIEDIHGNLSSLNNLLSKVLTELGSEDTLVFLGDYIDRGPDSRRCVDRVIEVQNESPFPVVALCGNHEDWTNGTQKIPVPRHKEINERTAKSILKQAKELNN